jgi:hypothetical protein
VINVTTVIVMITVFVQGVLTEPLIRLLKIPMNVNMTDYIRGLNMSDYTGSRDGLAGMDWERKYLYPWILRKKVASASTLRILSPDDAHHRRAMDIEVSDLSPTSSGGGTLYDGNHAREKIDGQLATSPSMEEYFDPYEGLSNSAKRSVHATTPHRVKSTNTLWSSHDSSPHMSIAYASSLATAAASGSIFHTHSANDLLSIDYHHHHDRSSSAEEEKQGLVSSLPAQQEEDIHDFASLSIAQVPIKSNIAVMHDDMDTVLVEADIESLIQAMHHQETL